ncbi:MAG: TetR/AcrR family transcriptional regulator [Hydrogenophilaceae bacterium]|jgi:AcrR family transcriptional regulator|nr:TetR/AcrR family transcriptional regulator [Hydrogenophilaceae bacterium]
MAKAKPRYERDDWIELGLALLSRHGPEALTLERLTDAAKKTRGSFYHHFEDHRAFLEALGECWLERETDEPIALAEAARLSGKRRETLARRAATIDHALERNLRRLAASEPVIAAIVAESDARRIAYLVRLFRSELGLDAADALARARIQHCAFVGAQMVFPDADERFRLKHEATMKRTLWRK